MTTPRYADVAWASGLESLPLLAGTVVSAAQMREDLSSAGVPNQFRIDGRDVDYYAPEQPVTDSVLLYRVPSPNDHDAESHLATTHPAPPRLDSKQAMLLFMQRLAGPDLPQRAWRRGSLKNSRDAHELNSWQGMARRWLSQMKYRADAVQQGWNLFQKVATQRPELLNVIDENQSIRASLRTYPLLRSETRNRLQARPGAGIARLKRATYAEEPKPTVSMPSRYFRKRLEHMAEQAIITAIPAAA